MIQEIDGTRYQFRTMGAKTARRLDPPLLRIAGPLVATLLKGAADVGAIPIEDIATALEGLRPDDYELIVDTLASHTQVASVFQGARGAQELWTDLAPVYDTHFAGKHRARFRWLVEALRFQYADFFAGWGTASPLAATQTPSHSTPTSIGSSGVS